MNINRTWSRISLISTSCLLVSLGGCGGGGDASQENSNSASNDAVQSQIDRVLSESAGGTQTGAREVSFEGGDLVLEMQDPEPKGEDASNPLKAESDDPTEEKVDASTLYYQRCPIGWYCFYEHINYNRSTGGWMLRYRGCNRSGLTGVFPAWFRNKTSSWVNYSGVRYVAVKDGNTVIWTEPGYRASPWVGQRNNDRADKFTCYSR